MTEESPTDEELRRPAASRLAVLGQPIAHSKSPAIHHAAYEVLNLPWDYEAIECGTADLEGFLRSRDGRWRGLSLTMPLKEEARRLAAVVDPVAEESGVVNTMLRLADDASGRPRWAGFNTDVAGLAAAIERGGLDAARTVVLGSGATAVSAALAARRLGAQHIEIIARNAEAIGRLIERFDGTSEPGGDSVRVSGSAFEDAVLSEDAARPTLVISTLPGPAAGEIPIPAASLKAPLFDVAYHPWPSPLAERWRSAGGEAHAGLDMLVEQALVQIRIFVNGDPDAELDDERALADVMRSASMGG